MLDPKMFEAWSGLLRTMRASSEAMDALAPLAGLSRRQLAALLGQATAGETPSGRPPAGMEYIEQFWNMFGLVPRYRYDDLQERYEALRTRLEDAEVTIQRLRKLLDEKGGEPEARQVLDAWALAVKETLKTQAGIVRSLAGGPISEKSRPPEAPATPARRTRTSRRSGS